MASPSAGSSHSTGVPLPGSALNVAGASVDTAQLDRLVEKALTAASKSRYVQAAAYYGRAADEARRLHGENFICTCLTLQQSANLSLQSSLEVVTPNEVRALYDEGWKLASSCLPLIICRMDANTMLPGRCTAVELAFSKWFGVTSRSKYCKPFFSSTRGLQLTGLCMGYCTAITAASLLLAWLHVRHDAEAEAFVLRVVDCMLPAVRSLRDRTSPNEECFAHTIQNALSGQPRPTYHAAFLASLRTKWTDDAMVQMRRERSLLDVSENIGENIEKSKRGGVRTSRSTV